MCIELFPPGSRDTVTTAVVTLQQCLTSLHACFCLTTFPAINLVNIACFSVVGLPTVPYFTLCIPRHGLSLLGMQDVPYFGLSIPFASNTSISSIRIEFQYKISRYVIVTIACICLFSESHAVCRQETVKRSSQWANEQHRGRQTDWQWLAYTGGRLNMQ